MIVIALVAIVMALGTWFVGWTAVPVIALAIGVVLRHQRGQAGRTALGAALGWGLLLGIDAVSGPIGRLTSTLGGAMELPGLAVLALTLVFPGSLAWSAATVGEAIGRRSRTVATSSAQD